MISGKFGYNFYTIWNLTKFLFQINLTYTLKKFSDTFAIITSTFSKNLNYSSACNKFKANWSKSLLF